MITYVKANLRFWLALLVGCCFLPLAPSATAQDNPTQDRVFELMDEIENTYGVGFAYPVEWQAASANEVIQFNDYLTVILESLARISETLYALGADPNDPTRMTPADYFRLHFDNAHIVIDRTTQLGSNFAGKTNPIYGNGAIVGYSIQLTGEGMRQPFTLAHELGHVVDSLLTDLPHTQHVEFLGGEWAATAWIPGKGYIGNEHMFPRAVGGPNEDFADTFGQMMMGKLSPLNSTAPRWSFMVTHIHEWLEAIRNLPAN
ncbi:MAG: hypothetical protein HY862_15225 [Chloroflexi bacterium]|nr:hypothetical protein [Chloroflexota bacterium]